MQKIYKGVYSTDSIFFNIIYEYNSCGIIKIYFAKKKNILESFSQNENNKKTFFDRYFLKKSDLAETYIAAPLTDFQKKVLIYLRKNIPFGKIITYSELSKKLFGTINYSRAIGNVMNKNPLPLYFPCHRVIGLNNDLKGFSSGIEYKKFLLKFEGINFNY